MPEVESPHEKETVTSVSFHPLEFAAGDAEPLMVGAVASRLIVTDWDEVPPALVAVQVSVVPVVSLVIVVEPHPELELIGDSLSMTVHETLTSLTYQPLFPSVPTTPGVMIGGVESEGACTVTV